jgi:hypothetical protein
MKFFSFFGLIFFSFNLSSQVIIKNFEWKIYKTKHFDIYYYSDSKPLIPYASYYLELAYEKAKTEYNPYIDKRIPFFLYASANDMKQNSITEVGDGTGGLTEPYKDRFMVYNDGSKKWLRDVIFHEFGHEAQFSILIDGWWETPRILKTIIYPLWMLEGMSENMTEEWDIAMEDMYLRDYTVDNKLPPLSKLFGFYHLKPHQITLAYKTGAKAVRFLREEYGKDKPSIILNLYRDLYDIDSVLKRSIGITLDEFDRKFKDYIERKYYYQLISQNLRDASLYGKALTRDIDDIPIFNISPVIISSSSFAYISTIKGHPPSIVIERDGKKKIIRGDEIGFENVFYSRFTFPIRSVSISHNKRYIIFSSQKNSREYLVIYDIEKDRFRKVLFEDLNEARQFSFSGDDKKIVFVGMDGCFNKIYEIDFDYVMNNESVKKKDLKLIVDGEMDKRTPIYITEEKIAFSCEVGGVENPQNNLCIYDRKEKSMHIYDLGMDVLDIAYAANRIYFVSDKDGIYNLYSYSLVDGKIYRHTSFIGGGFTPWVEDDKILISYFRHGSINIYVLDEKSIDYEYIGNGKKSLKEIDEGGKNLDEYEGTDYKFKASTDLFLPALLYSSPGGLFVFTYWQASDYLGRHNLSIYTNYNSYSPYLNLASNYIYNRYRTKFLSSTTIYNFKDKNSYGIDYKRKYLYSLNGVLYPFDRYKTLSVYLGYKDNKYKYIGYDYTDFERERFLMFSYYDNHLNGLYLTAVYGFSFNVVFSYYDEFMNGNKRYNLFYTDFINYIPLSRKSTFANRYFVGLSNGRDKPEYSYGGIKGIRGFMDSGRNENYNLIMYNFEARFCLTYIDYYMRYIFPDFYFKAIYFKVFGDNAYGWNDKFKISLDSIKNSVGFGFNLHTFILQTYQIVLSFDWSFNTKNGSRIMYFYLGPLF